MYGERNHHIYIWDWRERKRGGRLVYVLIHFLCLLLTSLTAALFFPIMFHLAVPLFHVTLTHLSLSVSACFSLSLVSAVQGGSTVIAARAHSWIGEWHMETEEQEGKKKEGKGRWSTFPRYNTGYCMKVILKKGKKSKIIHLKSLPVDVEVWKMDRLDRWIMKCETYSPLSVYFNMYISLKAFFLYSLPFITLLKLSCAKSEKLHSLLNNLFAFPPLHHKFPNV